MNAYPTLAPNACHDGPQPPQGRYAHIVADMHRLAGHQAPLDIAQACFVEAGAHLMHLRRRPDPERLELVRWLGHHACRWMDKAAEAGAGKVAA